VISATTALGEVTEGGVATFGLTRTGDVSQALTVNIDPNIGAAKLGSDFTAPTTVTFAAGSATATYSVQTNTDSLEEGSETIEFRITEGAGYTVGLGDGNVTDLVDAGPLPTMSISDVSANEGAQLNFKLSMSEIPTERLTVTYQIIHGTTTTGDVTAGTFTLNIPQGHVGDRGFNVATGNDSTPEADETFTVKILSVKNAAGVDVYQIVDAEGTGTIINNDGTPPAPVLPAISVSAPAAGVDEGGDLVYTFTRTGSTTTPLNVAYTVGGPATAGDFTAPSGTATFAAGSATATVTIKSTDDTTDEQDETVVLTVTPNATAYTITQATATATINANDTPAPLEISVEDVTVAEDIDGGQMVFNVKLSAPATQDIKVTYTITDGSATDEEDYSNPGGGEIWFMAGDQERGIVLPVYGDATVEGDETVQFTLTGVTEGNATIVKSTATGTLANDDEAAPPALSEISVSAANVAEGGDLVYTFTRTNADAPLDVAYTVGGAATAADFTAPSGTVQFAAGATTATVTVKTNNDTTDEPDETVVLTVTPNAAAYMVAQGTATATILDNDEPVIVAPTDVNVTAATPTKNYTGGAGSNDTLTLLTTGIVAGINTINLDGTTVGTTQWVGGTIQEFENIKLNAVAGTGTLLTINGDEENNIITVGEMTGTGRTNKAVNVVGGAGDDTINYIGTGPAAQGSVLSGGTGNDTITVGSAVIIDDTVASGLSGNDTYDFGTNAGRQEVRFGLNGGNDIIKNYSVGDATVAPDVLNLASAGIQADNVSVAETGGNTVFTINQGGSTSTVTVQGATGLTLGRHWTAEGTVSAPLPQATTGDDTLTAAISNAPVDGLAGNDTLVFDSFGLTAGGTNIISLGGISGPTPIVGTPYAGKTITNVENITFKGVTSASAIHNMNVSGTEGANKIVVEATTEAVHLIGWGGDDVFDFMGTGTSGNSVLSGGSGNDTINAKSALNINDVGSNSGASGNDTYNLGAGAQRVDFWNASGNDTINGFVKGEDKLYFNTLTNQPANTVSISEVGGDTVITTSTGGTVTVKGVTGLTQGTDWNGNKTVTVPVGGDPTNIDEGSPTAGSTLSEQSDIYNDAAGNSATLIAGLGGNDTIYGRDGNDVIEGGMGADIIYGGSGNDRIYGEDGNDTMAGGNDTLSGGDGNDIVAGESGDDVIDGGYGADTLNGLEGADTYVFHSVLDSLPTGGDTIDWQDVDTLDFRSFDFDQNTSGVQGRSTSVNVVNGSAPGGVMAADTFYYDAATGKLSLSTDVDGIADFTVTLNVVQEDFKDPTHPTSLSADDFRFL
jgi:Ca2+-binding RTX toxin-like protein